MNILQLISIIIEFIIVIISLTIAIQKKKIYGYGFALTFAIYVFYDLARLFALSVNEILLYSLFFVATLSAAVSLWSLYKEL